MSGQGASRKTKGKVYTITTAGQVWRQRARTFKAALRKAWQARPPKSVGLLVQFDAPDWETRYSLGHVAVQMAGFKCEEPTLEEYLSVMRAGGRNER